MEKVSFYSEGYRLSGYVRIPKTYSNRKIPGIVVCHGFSGMIEFYGHDIAERLTEGGYATLIFYHRGLGESEGQKGRIIPLEEAEDIRNAITYFQTRAEVDPNQIGIYGTSFGGGNVIYVAGIDSRVKCVVSTGGFGDGERWLKTTRSLWEWAEFRKKIEEDRVKRVLIGSSQYVDPREILPVDPETLRLIGEAWKAYSQKWGITGYPLETADTIIDYKPELVADRIAPRPILLIHTSDDVVLSPEESISVYQKAKEPKKLVILDGYIHEDVYKVNNPEAFERVMTTAIDWYQQYLPTE